MHSHFPAWVCLLVVLTILAFVIQLQGNDSNRKGEINRKGERGDQQERGDSFAVVIDGRQWAVLNQLPAVLKCIMKISHQGCPPGVGNQCCYSNACLHHSCSICLSAGWCLAGNMQPGVIELLQSTCVCISCNYNFLYSLYDSCDPFIVYYDPLGFQQTNLHADLLSSVSRPQK